MFPFPPVLSLSYTYAPFCFPPSIFLGVSLPFHAALSGLPSFQAWPIGDNMFWGDKQAHAAAEGSLGKAMVVCAVACVATRGPDKSQAVSSSDHLYHIVFRDTVCLTMQVVTVRLDGTMPQALHFVCADHGSNLQMLVQEGTGCIPPA